MSNYEIIVYPGTYNETIGVACNGLTIIAVGGPDVTTIQGSSSDTSRTVVALTGSDIWFENFTVKWATPDIPSTLGIAVQNDGCVVKNCTVTSNTEDGIKVMGSNNATVINNTVSTTLAGVRLIDSSNSDIENNTLQGRWGVVLDGGDDSNRVVGNTVTSAGDRGIWVRNGSDSNLVKNNTVSNSRNGIEVEGSENNVVAGNDVSGATIQSLPGICVGSAVAPAPGTIVENNYIHGNSIGVKILSSDLTGVRINHNNIAGNTLIGLNNESWVPPIQVVDAEYNWWGAADGPGGPGGSGSGDNVSPVDFVDYEPFLSDIWPDAPGP